jgi:hypothetical protein
LDLVDWGREGVLFLYFAEVEEVLNLWLASLFSFDLNSLDVFVVFAEVLELGSLDELQNIIAVHIGCSFVLLLSIIRDGFILVIELLVLVLIPFALRVLIDLVENSVILPEVSLQLVEQCLGLSEDLLRLDGLLDLLAKLLVNYKDGWHFHLELEHAQDKRHGQLQSVSESSELIVDHKDLRNVYLRVERDCVDQLMDQHEEYLIDSEQVNEYQEQDAWEESGLLANALVLEYVDCLRVKLLQFSLVCYKLLNGELLQLLADDIIVLE